MKLRLALLGILAFSLAVSVADGHSRTSPGLATELREDQSFQFEKQNFSTIEIHSVNYDHQTLAVISNEVVVPEPTFNSIRLVYCQPVATTAALNPYTPGCNDPPFRR